MSLTLAQLARRLGGRFTGDPELSLENVAKIEEAKRGEVTFLANPKYRKFLDTTAASAVIVQEKTTTARADLALILVPDPYTAFVKALNIFQPQAELLPAGIHDRAVVAASAMIGTGARIGACAVIGERAMIGEGTTIGPGVYVGDDASVGAGSLIYPNVTILPRCRVGNRVIIHSGTVIGSDGFGFAPSGEAYEKIPQLGIVLVDDDVEIGSNCSVDRATMGVTHIRRGVKIDNLVQIAHNVEVGENSVIVAQTGVSGSTTIGRHVTLAGQVGIVGHISIADNIAVTAQSGVSKSLTNAGKVYRGSPAQEFHEELRLEAALRQLPELIKTVREMEKLLKEKPKEELPT